MTISSSFFFLKYLLVGCCSSLWTPPFDCFSSSLRLCMYSCRDLNSQLVRWAMPPLLDASKSVEIFEEDVETDALKNFFDLLPCSNIHPGRFPIISRILPSWSC